MWQQISEKKIFESISDLQIFKKLEDQGYANILLARYPSLRKYFAEFLHLPYKAKSETENLLRSIHLICRLDTGELKKLPDNVPTGFIPKELRGSLRDKDGKIQRNTWELGVAIAMKEALHSGDLFVPKSKRHVSFWDMVLNQHHWQEIREAVYENLQQPYQEDVKASLILQFHQSIGISQKQFVSDTFAEIKNGSLKLT